MLNTKSLSKIQLPLVFVVTILGLIALTSISIVKAYNKPYETRIVLNKENYNLLVIAEQKTEIVSGISQADMDDFNQNPTPEKIQNFMKSIALQYGVDWKFVYAIGYHESGNYGSSLARRNNNYFGRKASSSGYASWSTPEEAIRNQFEYLKTRYFDRGLTTPASINRVYAEDMSWHYAVESVMASL